MDSKSTYPTPFTLEEIIAVNGSSFFDAASKVFQFQYTNNTVFNTWVNTVGKNNQPTGLVFLPITFFKTHQLTVCDIKPEIIFTSSGSTGTQTSSHYVAKAAWYVKSFTEAFKLFYGAADSWAIIGLLPSYLERDGSSLVLMTEHLIQASNNADSGLYLYDFESLKNILVRREATGQKTWLIGVTYALLDFASAYPVPLSNTIIVETGGMKGRKKELTRMEVQQVLKEAFSLPAVHSEYGMTELLSQAYSSGNGIFKCPPWMKVLVRDEDDPLTVKLAGTGALCIIDLANMYSCSFIATDDIGKVYEDGSFEILGRMDNSDVRGCSLLAL